jgi:hypothetical protein
MYLRGPSTKDQGELLSSDIRVYDYLGKNNEMIVPGYRYLISWKDLYATYGDFTDFTDNVIGAYSFVGELYQSSTETYRSPDSKSSDEEEGFFGENSTRTRERLKFNDHVAQGELYVDWKPFKHPTYGDIEIGGWVKMSSRLPHPFMLQDLVHRNAAAVIFSSEQTPEINMEIFEKTKVGKNLYRVRVRLVNSKAIPSMTYSSVQKKRHPQDMLKVSGSGIDVVSGGKLNNVYRDQVTYKEHKPEVQFLQVPGFGKVEYQFLVSGKGKIKVEYTSLKAKNISKTIDL